MQRFFAIGLVTAGLSGCASSATTPVAEFGDEDAAAALDDGGAGGGSGSSSSGSGGGSSSGGSRSGSSSGGLSSSGGGSSSSSGGSSSSSGGSGSSSGGSSSSSGGSGRDAGVVDAGSRGASDAGSLGYASQIAPILQSPCTRACHGGAGGLAISFANLVNVKSGELPNVDYVTPGSPGTSYLYCKCNPSDCSGLTITGTVMPPGQALSASNLTLIKNWIQQGAAP